MAELELKFGDIFYVDFPFHEDKTISQQRPAIFIKKNKDEVTALIIKVTKQLKHLGKDKYKIDFKIDQWEQAGLDHPSLAQISQSAIISITELTEKIGSLVQEDIETLMDGIIRHIKFLEGEKKESNE